MEKRLLLAIVLSFLVLVFYQALFLKKEPPPEPGPITQPGIITETEQSTAQKVQETEPPPQIEEKTEFQPSTAQNEEEIVIETSLYRAVWSNRGAVLKSWKLKKYLDDNKEQEYEIVPASSAEINKYPFSLNTDDPAFDLILNSSLYATDQYALELTNGESGELRFEFADENGNRVEKVLTFKDGTYVFDIQVFVWKNGQNSNFRTIWGPGIGNPAADAAKQGFGKSSGMAVFAANKVYRMDERKYKPEQSVYNFVNWAAYEDNYFTALFVTSGQNTSAALIKEEKDMVPYFFLVLNNAQKVYIGPKAYDELNQTGYQAQKLVKFGFFGFIAELLYRAIKGIHKSVPNWGFSIIILTLIIKIIFFPLTYSSSKSMAKMQELQPKLKALKAKYKKAKQDISQRRKLNEETMALYKEHGVNPAGGCLPMLIQLPIFWGFFRLLLVAVEFRHAPFILWVTDLSVKDPYYVTPILMGITQFISQKMTPTSADSSQQKMMLIMPVVMTIFFMNFQSGLVLYWLTNNVLQIGQQYITNRLMNKKKRETHAKRRKK